MDKLFEHVDGNRFKLNEDIDKSISKMEESLGLNYIRKVLVPAAIKSWNNYCFTSKEFKNCTVLSPQFISKTLKKMFHAQHSKTDKTTTDVIRYDSDLSLLGMGGKKLPEPFSFELHKHIQSGKLMASFMIPRGHYRTYFVGDTIE